MCWCVVFKEACCLGEDFKKVESFVLSGIMLDGPFSRKEKPLTMKLSHTVH